MCEDVQHSVTCVQPSAMVLLSEAQFLKDFTQPAIAMETVLVTRGDQLQSQQISLVNSSGNEWDNVP